MRPVTGSERRPTTRSMRTGSGTWREGEGRRGKRREECDDGRRA